VSNVSPVQIENSNLYKPPQPGSYKKPPAPGYIPPIVKSQDQPMIPEINTKKNLAYINITGEGAKPVGPIGIKKAEKELILRRYKYNHPSDNIQRVAMIYG